MTITIYRTRYELDEQSGVKILDIHDVDDVGDMWHLHGEHKTISINTRDVFMIVTEGKP